MGNHNAVELSELAFRSLRLAVIEDNGTFPLRIEPDTQPTAEGHWCHGIAGYLWCLLQAFGRDRRVAREFKWAYERYEFATKQPLDNTTYCHGLSGQLELWRMLMAFPRYRSLAHTRTLDIIAAIRLLSQRVGGHSVWCSEEPKVITPDLWVGYLGPATALALHSIGSRDALLSSSWLRRCARAS